MSGLYPWIGYQATERVSAWTAAGYGTGSLRLTPAGSLPLETGLSMGMAAAGARGELIGNGAGGFGLAIKTDALWVGTATDGVDHPAGRMSATHASVTRMRAGLESSRETRLAGTLVTPSAEVGLRRDGGDAETGFGVDMGGLYRHRTAGTLAFAAAWLRAVGVRYRGFPISSAWRLAPWSCVCRIWISPGTSTGRPAWLLTVL